MRRIGVLMLGVAIRRPRLASRRSRKDSSNSAGLPAAICASIIAGVRGTFSNAPNAPDKRRMDKFFDLLGLGTPFLYAAGTYAFFHWLDSNASQEAKAAFARLLDAKRYDATIISAAILDFFDRVYTYPLLTRRALCRSAFLTLFITAIYFYEVNILTSEREVKVSGIIDTNVPLYTALWREYVASLIINICSDFISLFVARRWLSVAGSRPIFALVASSLLFVVVIGISCFLRLMVLFFDLFFFFQGPFDLLEIFFSNSVLNLLLQPSLLLLPALAAFMWLPLLGLSLGLVRILVLLSPMVQKLQWAIKGGNDHPLDAAGYVAAVIVFLATILWRHVSGGPSVSHTTLLALQ
jgi:hypothetical protein